MSRKRLAWLLGILGLLVGAPLVLFGDAVASILADARTENITGAGVDLFLRTAYPLQGEEVAVEVSARGGDRAGIEEVSVSRNGTVIASAKGSGVTWGSTITSGKQRGSEDLLVSLPLGADLKAGEPAAFSVTVSYVCAMATCDYGTFSNEHYTHTVELPVAVYSEAGRGWAIAWAFVRALLLFLVWGLSCYGIARLLKRLDAPAPVVGEGDKDAVEMLGIGLMCGLMGVGALGYWFFARPLSASLGTADPVAMVGLTAFWTILPPIVSWLLVRRIKPMMKALLRSVASGTETMDVIEIEAALKDTGAQVQRRKNVLEARVKEGGRWRVKLLQVPATLNQLDVQATDLIGFLEIANALVRRFGPIRVIQGTDILLVDGSKSPTQIAIDDARAKIEKLGQVLGALRNGRTP